MTYKLKPNFVNDLCEQLLSTQITLCRQLLDCEWTDDWEYVCWAYLVGDRKLPLQSKESKTNPEATLPLLIRLKDLAEALNGWVNDVTYFEMERWLILYDQWKQRQKAN